MNFLINITRKDDIFFQNGIGYLSNPVQSEKFRQTYLEVRINEGRLLMDDQVKSLPLLPNDHTHFREWQLRADSLKRFEQYIKRNPPGGHVLDLGCGNGWFTHKIAELTGQEIIGLDINIAELEQAARIFKNENLRFFYGDIFEDIFHQNSFHLITLNASAQYFPDIHELIERLFYFLQDAGEIHFLDTHFYKDEDAAQKAAEGTKAYYSTLGFPEMSSHYHHHLLKALHQMETIKLKIGNNNSKLKSQNLKLFRRKTSPFPWIRIAKKI
jgi:ubiquinone/menaquinone biosynthesis C-methylase UbiE